MDDFAGGSRDALAVKLRELLDDVTMGDTVKTAEGRLGLEDASVLAFEVGKLEGGDGGCGRQPPVGEAGDLRGRRGRGSRD